RSRVDVSTLHTLARSLLERSHGSPAQPMGAHIRIADKLWSEVLWGDLLLFSDPDGNLTLDALMSQLHNCEFSAGPPWSDAFRSRCSVFICRAASSFVAQHREVGAIEKIYLPLQIDESAHKVRVVATNTPTGAVDYVRRFIEAHAADYDKYLQDRAEGEDSD